MDAAFLLRILPALLEGLDETALIQRYTADIDAFRAADQNRRPWLYQR